MGTSQSSTGATSQVPLVPPWVPPVPQPYPENIEPDQPLPNEPFLPVAPLPNSLAPLARFGPSRSSLGQYASSGSTSDMQRGLGHYVGKGLGGAATATQRFSATT